MGGMFDDLMETDTPSEVKPQTESDSSTDEKTETDKVEVEPRKTLTVPGLDQLPAGFVDVKTFAWKLTQRNLEQSVADGRTPGPDDMVDTQAVYAATRGKRWSLPSLEAVTPEGTKLGVVIPLNEGLTAWDERPERGSGGGVTMTPQRRETRILRAGKFRAQLAKMNKRHDRITELLNEVGATWDDADAAFNAWLETEDGKKEIADADKNDKNGDE